MVCGWDGQDDGTKGRPRTWCVWRGALRNVAVLLNTFCVR